MGEGGPPENDSLAVSHVRVADDDSDDSVSRHVTYLDCKGELQCSETSQPTICTKPHAAVSSQQSINQPLLLLLLLTVDWHCTYVRCMTPSGSYSRISAASSSRSSAAQKDPTAAAMDSSLCAMPHITHTHTEGDSDSDRKVQRKY